MPQKSGWTDDLATGNSVIDDQHKEIFRRADILLEELKKGEAEKNVSETVAFLTDYVVEHFRKEEVLQELYDYPAFKAHKARHERFIIEFSMLKEKYETGLSNNIAAELVNLVITWLMDHIEKEDKALAAHIRKVEAR